MKILLCHNYYQQRGGEDQSFESEMQLLRQHGHDVRCHTCHNDEVAKLGHLKTAARTLWNRQAYREVRSLLRQWRPDVMHCTNTFPLLSPSVPAAGRAEGVPVVLSLRNYRLACLNSYFFRDGRVCEDCLGRAPWPGVRHACYRDSRSGSAVVAAMLMYHRARRTWQRSVDRFFTPSAFARAKLAEAGLPAERIDVKPNFVDPDPGPGDGGGGYAIFAGRLSPEKGIGTLLDAWRRLDGRLPLKIVGDGPLQDTVAQAAAVTPGVEWLGRREHGELLDLIGDAVCLVQCSEWYETFGRTIVEAHARGTPTLVAQLGAVAELVEPGRSGLLFQPGDAGQLADCVARLLDDPATTARMRQQCRAVFLERFTAERNHQLLMDIYRRAGAEVDGAK